MSKFKKILWFTGLSGSGKSTLAQMLKIELEERGSSVLLLDGDVLRDGAKGKFDFSPDGIRANNIYVAKRSLLESQNYDYVLVAVIAPFKDSRKKTRALLGTLYCEVFVKVSVEEVIRRDVKGLYAKVLRGEIKNFIGIDPQVPYENPLNPEVMLDTEFESIDESFKKILDVL